MNEITYLPDKKKSRLDYLKYSGIVVILVAIFLFLRMIFHPSHNHHFSLKVFAVISIISIIFICFETITTEIKFNFDLNQLEIYYLTLFSIKNKIEVPFSNLHFEFRQSPTRSNQIWNLSIYNDKKRIYKISTFFMDSFSKETLGKIANENLFQ